MDDFRRLETDWNPLLQRSAADCIYLTWEYLTTWWEVFGGERQLWILAVRDATGSLVGLAPMMTGPGIRMRRFFKELTFIGGQGDSTSECLDFIVQKGSEREVMELFLGTIRRGKGVKWNLLSFPIAVSDSSTMIMARRFLGDWGSPRTREREAPYCTFHGTWEEFLQTRSSKFRSTVRNRTKKMHSQHQVQLLAGGRDLPLEEAFLHVVQLTTGRWGDQLEAFHTLKFLEFHRRLIPRLAERGWLLLLVLMVDGRAAAARYDFVYGGKIWGFQGGWDPDYARLSIGTVMNALTFQWAIEHHGVREYDFGADNARYKSEWADGSRTLMDVMMAHPRSLPARVMLLAHDVQRARKARQTPPAQEPATEPATESAGFPITREAT